MQARMRSSSLSVVSKARTHGEGSGATSVGCMGGWIHTGLRGTLAGDLNNCRGWDGGIGWVATSCMSTGATLSVLMFSKVGTGAFLPCQPHQSHLEAPCNVRDLHHQYLE
jgi:hypothetical protein